MNTDLKLKPFSLEEQIKQTMENIKKKKEEEAQKTILSSTRFAGEEIQIEKELTEKEKKLLELKEKSKTHKSLDSVVDHLQKKKDMTIFDKTRVDWDKFVTKENLSKELDYARKDGFLAKKRFIEETNFKLLQQKKVEEKKQKYTQSLKSRNII